MKKNKKNLSAITKFELIANEYIYIVIPHATAEELQMCDRLAGFYHTCTGEEFAILDQYSCGESEIDSLILLLTAALNNELELNHIALPNIGYQWNERIHNPHITKERWIGAKYLCFSKAGGPETFIYTIGNAIYLEIIPLYPWLFGAKPKGLKKISFKQFLKDYKPYVKTIIPRETAKTWLATAQNLRDIIDRNEAHNKKKQVT